MDAIEMLDSLRRYWKVTVSTGVPGDEAVVTIEHRFANESYTYRASTLAGALAKAFAGAGA